MNVRYANYILHSRSLVILGALVGCSGNAPIEHASAESSAIVGGQPASKYPEAVLIDMYQDGQLYAACSGSVIAPQVVLTAGHCVDGTDSWTVTAPFAGGQTATGQNGTTYDWHESGSENVNPDHHDIGLVFLDNPITLNQYPELASSPLADGAKVLNIGRIQDGMLSHSALYVSQPVTVSDGTQVGFPFDYGADEVIQSGDSGGPDEVPESRTHKIVSVNSGGGNGEVLARVDLLYTWIQHQIAKHGGGGFTSPVLDAGAPHGGGDGGGGTDASSGVAGSGGGSGDAAAGGSPSGSSGAGYDAGTTGAGSGAAPPAGPSNGAAPSSNGETTTTTSGCSVGHGGHASDEALASIGLLALLGARRRRRHPVAP
jgi:MYXO-CTERM domain-containing protein